MKFEVTCARRKADALIHHVWKSVQPTAVYIYLQKQDTFPYMESQMFL